MPPQSITILDERNIQTTPAPGEFHTKVAITYQVTPLPPTVVFVDATDLADVVWRSKHPGQDDVPQNVQQLGDDVRRQHIREHMAARRSPAARTI